MTTNTATLAPAPAGQSLATFSAQNFWPRDLDQLERLSRRLALSTSLLPKHISDQKDIEVRTGEVLAHLLWGFTLGLGPMQSLRAVYIVHGRAGLYAADQIGIVKAHPDCEFLRVKMEVRTVNGKKVEVPLSDAKSCTWETKRRGQERQELTYTMEQADKEGLTSNTKYKTAPDVMLRWRCATRLLGYEWADVLRGLETAEQVQAEEKEGGWAERVTAPQPSRAPTTVVVDATVPPHDPITGEVKADAAPAVEEPPEHVEHDPDSPDAFAKRLIEEMRAAPDMKSLQALAKRGAGVPEDLRAALNAAYAECKKALAGRGA